MSDGGPPRRLDIWDAFSEGVSLATARNGFVLMAVFFAVETISVLLIVAGGSLYLPLDQAGDVVGRQSALPVGAELSLVGSIGAILLASVFSILVSTPVTIVAIRTFVVGATDRIPDTCLFHRVGRATLSAVGAIVLTFVVFFAMFFGVPLLALLAVGWLLEGWVAIAVLVAALLGLVVGTAFVWIHLLFVTHEIAVRDRGVVGAFRGSWATVRGNRLRVFVLGALVAALRTGVGGATGPAFRGELGPLTLALLGIGLVVSAIFGVAAVAVMARAYRQISPDAAVRSDSIGE